MKIGLFPHRQKQSFLAILTLTIMLPMKIATGRWIILITGNKMLVKLLSLLAKLTNFYRTKYTTKSLMFFGHLRDVVLQRCFMMLQQRGQTC